MSSPSPQKTIDVAIGIILHGGRILICQRNPDRVLGGLWEFPGGKVEAGETLEHCLHRELREELDITTTIRQALPAIDHHYPHARVRLHPFLCDLLAGEPKPIESADLKWVSPVELSQHPFPPANASLLRQLAQILGD